MIKVRSRLVGWRIDCGVGGERQGKETGEGDRGRDTIDRLARAQIH